MSYVKKIGALGAAAAMVAPTLTACGGDADATPVNAEGAVIVELWHASGGAAGQTLEDLVEQFNYEHRGEIEVRAAYQGSYGDAIAKFIASVQTGDLPAIMQANDVQTAFMKDSDVIVPVEELNERYGGYDFDEVAPAVLNYYEMEDTVYSMPAMISQPVMYVNNDLLAEAGLDVSDVETTDGLIESARTIKEKTGSAGFTFHLDGWFMEQAASMLGEELCTPENGTGESPATEFALDNPELVDLWSTYGELYATGEAHNPGKDGAAATGAFTTGEAVVQLGSSGGLGNLMANEPDFDWSVHRLPRDNDRAGAVPGGNSLWAIDLGHNEEEQEAVWEFMKFIGSDENQAKIFRETGYLPTTNGALDLLDGIDSNQEAILDQLHTNPVNTVTAGCHTGALNIARGDYERAMSEIANGADPVTSLDEAKVDADAKIETYNERAALTDSEDYE